MAQQRVEKWTDLLINGFTDAAGVQVDHLLILELLLEEGLRIRNTKSAQGIILKYNL